ncbi:MAG: DEAD/DEAH box helicase [Desulfobacteraceae bacterium]|nr:DEAD/DEAH box helicase [Desulfobacteraceae bacterium]
MQGIVFVYDPEVAAKNSCFTVRLEERSWNGKRWCAKNDGRVFTVSCLKRLGSRMVDKSLFATAFRSESEFRSAEGRFFSGDEEFTLLRISTAEVPGFIKKAAKSRALCDTKGSPFGFKVIREAMPGVALEEEDGEFTVSVILNGKRMSHADYVLSGPHMASVFGKTVITLKPGFPTDLFKQFPCGKRFPIQDYDRVADTLAGFSDHIAIILPEKKEMRVIRPEEVQPVLSFDADLRFADLEFEYPEGIHVTKSETREIIFDREKHLELHRNQVREDYYKKVLKEAGAAFRGASRGDWFFSAMGLEPMLMDLKRRGFRLLVEGGALRMDAKIAWRLSVMEDRICVGGEIYFGKNQTGLEGLFDGFLCGQSWFELPDGSRGFMGQGVGGVLKDLEIRGDFKDEEVLFSRFDFAHVAEVMAGAEHLARDAGFQELKNFGDARQTDDPIKIPGSLDSILRPYQKLGTGWLYGLKQKGLCGILADDMGLGKTLQVLAFLKGLKEAGETGPSLLIVPKTLIWNWESEILKFTPDLGFRLHTGVGRTRETKDLASCDLVITSYALARQDADLFKGIVWNNLILDEAHAIKNPDARITREIKTLEAGFRLSLSGTPVENRPRDLWSQFDFLMPGFLGTREEFRGLYETGERPDALKALVRPFLLRRLKSQVCRELPPKTEEILYCDFEDEQKALYEKVLGIERDRLFHGGAGENDGAQSGAVHILTALLRLRQIACHPALLGGDVPVDLPSGKLSRVLDTGLGIIEGGYKILVFSQFTGHLKMVRERFDAEGILSFYLDGGTKDRKNVIDGFKTSKGPCVFFISLKAGGVGLNLTEAGYVFLLDPWWNPSAENQAVDRSHRIGQDNPVTVYRFITKGSIEEKVALLQKKKTAMVQAVVGDGDGDGAKPFTEEELADLIR